MTAPYRYATRASTLAKALEDSSGLMDYYAATTLQAVASSPTLHSRLGLVEFSGVLDWRPFKPLVQEAQAQRGKPEADQGTNIHAVVQALHEGRPVLVDDATRRDAEAVLAALEAMGREVVTSEEFVVTEGLPELCAGTRDMLVRRKDTRALQVADIKSTSTLGNARYRATSWAVQLAVYANGVPYPVADLERDRWQRPKIHTEQLRLCQAKSAPPVDKGQALVLEVERGHALVDVHAVDLTEGWRLAALACHVRSARKSAPLLGSHRAV